MALPNEPQRPFRLYVTHVDGEAHFLKISGQLDQEASIMIESLFESARENLEQGIGAAPPAAIQEGIVCAAKYKDGSYYRAKVINTANLSNGLVGVQFIDYGNKNVISLSTIRLLDNYDPMFLKIHGQATDYYLSRVISPSGKWDEPIILKLQGLLCYSEYPATMEAQTRTLPIISIQYKGNDLSNHLVSNRIGVALPIPKQEVILLQLTDNQHRIAWTPPVTNEAPPYYPEHVPFLINQNFPNPASAMRITQNVPVSFNGTPIHTPSNISQRLLVNKVSRNAINLRAPERQPHIHTPLPPQVQAAPPSPKKSATYKSRNLEVNTEHKVYVSYAEEGPELFAVQLVVDANKLQDMMDDINRRPHSSLAEPPMIGTVCLGRMSGDRIICRAIVTNLSGSQCKLFFVDFGDTEMVSYYDIFDIPEEFVKPHVLAIRFCLSKVKKLNKGPHLNEVFKQLVNGKVLTLKVVPPEGPPLIQYGELYLDNQNVLDLLLANMKDNLQFKWIEMLPKGSKKSVLVSYVDSCVKFYVQLSENIDALNAVMDAVKVHCKNSNSPGELPAGAVCCARFPDDDEWYRAMVRVSKGNQLTVVYVDYGNEQEINASDLRTITPELIKLPAQAIKCALKGYENKPIEKQNSNQLEMLALEKTLMAHIDGYLSNDTMLVTLIDDTTTPPLDVAKRMIQLSQPRSNLESKAPPMRKESQENFSSPESVTSDDGRRGYRREKSFKDERRDEEFGQRGGIFRSREPKDGFDRSGAGRHSDKRQDRGDRRKPRDNASGDDWEDSAAPSVRQNRDNRKKTKDQPEKGKNWKKDFGGVGKRLKQAAEAAHAHANASHVNANAAHANANATHANANSAHANAAAAANSSKTSVQDRLKRDNRGKTSHWGNNQNEANGEEERRDNWGNKKENWGEKKDRWGDKKESWGDKKESWGDKKESWGEKKDSWDDRNRGDSEGWNQNREFRDNRSERGGRSDRGSRGGRSDRGGRGGRSNMNPRERAERSDRSFGSDGDKRSERSFKSEGSRGRGRGGRPYQPRVPQYKELPNPVPLDTPFAESTVEIGSQQEVSVTWIVSPENFHTQILSLQSKFLEMMHTIPELYKGVRSYTGPVQVGNSVLARYPSDGVLYRATIVSVQPFSKFIVRYVDFGNKQLVDAKDIWQLDSQLMELPKMAVHCSLLGVAPVDGEWRSNPDIDLCFNAPRYQCVFQECVEDHYKVYLWNNGVSVADTLVEKNLAISAANQEAVTLKDEPIDLTIIVGQQINCRVTHVESFEKFYVQLDLDKAALVESSMAEYDASKLQQIPTESLAAGLDCTVKYEGKLYRAILSDVTDLAAVRAVLPDYGNEIATAADNFMILPTELSVYYYQSLECCLNNYSSESEKLMTIDELKQKLIGNKFIIYINYIDGIRLVATLYEPTGAKVAIFTPDEGAYDSVVPLCARAVFNYTHGVVYVTHIQSLSEVYLQKAGDEAKLTEMLDALYKYYEEGTPEALINPEIEGICAAKSADGNWYRATITSLTDTEATVQFSDYGNSETVPKESLRVLDTKFYEPCALALVASLGLVATRDDAVEKLKELTAEKELQATLAFGEDCWLTNLHLDGVDLSLQLISEKYAAPQLASEKEAVAEAAAPVEEAISLPEGCTQVYISHIDSPGQFWLQLADKVNAIEEIQAELQANANTYPDIDTREMGTICVAKYSADDQWYRAEILDSDTDITTVRFIDYGNTDVLDNQPDLIKSIPEQFKDVEKYAIRASVNAIPTGTGQWSEPASECFTQLVGDMSAPVDALVVLKDVTTYVDIYVNGQNLTDKLVSEGHATRSEEAECGGDLPSCFASHVNSPSEFWIQLESAAPELQAMEAAMVDAENFPALEEKEEGVICAAKYLEDGAWYRAQIIVDGSEGTEVLFMDYGNASITNELRNMPEELKTKPALSRKCALQKPRDIKSWSRKSEVKFNELAAEGATIFNIQFIAAGDISIVELYLEGKSVTEELVGLCEEQPPTERPTPVGQDIHSSGKISYVNSLDEFYIHLDDSSANIDKVSEALATAESFEPTTELKVGSLCAAFWSEDEQWYRAKILEFCDVGYHVQFIDYGNKAKCEDFRQLPESLSDIEPLAKCCRLAGFVDDPSNESAKSKLNDLVEELVTFQIEFLDSLKEPFLVKLLLNDTDLSAVLKTEDLDANSEPQNEISEENGNDESEILNDSLDSAKTVVENVSFKEEETNIDSSKILTDETTPKMDSKELDTASKTDDSNDVEQEKLNTSINDDTPKVEEVSHCESKDSNKEISDTETNEDVRKTPETKTSEDNITEIPETKTSEDNITEIPETKTSKDDITEIPETKTSEDNITEIPETKTSEDNVTEIPGTKTSEDNITKVPAKDASSDSLNTDIGYTSETLSPDKEIESNTNKKEMSPDKGIEVESKETSPNNTVEINEAKTMSQETKSNEAIKTE